MLKRFFPLILSSLLLAIALPCNATKISSTIPFCLPRQRWPNCCSKRSHTAAARQRTPGLLFSELRPRQGRAGSVDATFRHQAGAGYYHQQPHPFGR